MKDPYCQPRWSKPTAASISYRLQKNCRQTHKSNYLEEDQGGEPKVENFIQRQVSLLFFLFCLPTLTQVIPTGFCFVLFYFFVSPIFPSRPAPRATQIMNLQCNHHYSSTKIPGRKIHVSGQSNSNKGKLVIQKEWRNDFYVFASLSLPLYSHHLVLRVAPVIHNYGI